MSENHLTSPIRTVFGIGLAAFLLVIRLCSKSGNRCLNFFNIFFPGGKQQMRGDGHEGDPLPAPLGCALLPGPDTQLS